MMKKFDNLSEKAQSILLTLCSNFRSSFGVRAQFRCSVHYGLETFVKEVEEALRELKENKCIKSFRISDQETDEDTDMCYFNVNCDLNLSVEEMAEISSHSQTVFVAK